MKKLFFILITLILVFILFLITEVVLRISGYGTGLEVFKEEPLLKNYYVINKELGRRYFPNTQTAPLVSSDVMLVKKPENGLRLFVFGGSSAAGYPYFFNGAFSRMLKDRLIDMFPDRTVEIVNLAMPAVNSFTILDLAEDIIKYDPDMFLIYGGHNEFYGALGSGSTESIASRRFFIKLYLKLQHLRVFQLLSNTISKISNVFSPPATKEDTSNQTLMERMVKEQVIAYGSPLFLETHETFKTNIEEIKQIAAENNISLYLGELVSNIADQPPFKSVSGNQVNDSLLTLLNEYSTLNRSMAEMALKDPGNALYLYSFAKALQLEGHKEQAKRLFYFAKDYDALRFRASEKINQILKSLASNQTTFVAVKKYFEEQSDFGLIGNNLMLEHLHPNVKGNFLVAKAFAESIQKTTNKSGEIQSDTVYYKQIYLTAIDTICANYRIKTLLAGWPFREKSKVDEVIKSFKPKNLEEKVALDFWQNRVSWFDAHKTMAVNYFNQKNYKASINEYHALAKGRPFDNSVLNDLAYIYLANNNYQDALPVLKKSLAIKKTNFALRMTGSIFLQKKQVDNSIPLLEEALEMDPKDTQAMYNLAGAYMLKKDYSKTREILERLLKINPNHQQARTLWNRLGFN